MIQRILAILILLYSFIPLLSFAQNPISGTVRINLELGVQQYHLGTSQAMYLPRTLVYSNGQLLADLTSRVEEKAQAVEQTQEQCRLELMYSPYDLGKPFKGDLVIPRMKLVLSTQISQGVLTDETLFAQFNLRDHVAIYDGSENVLITPTHLHCMFPQNASPDANGISSFLKRMFLNQLEIW